MRQCTRAADAPTRFIGRNSVEICVSDRITVFTLLLDLVSSVRTTMRVSVWRACSGLERQTERLRLRE